MLTFDQGNKTDAITLLRRSLRDYEQLAQAFPNDRRIQNRLIVCLNNMGVLEIDLGQTEAALQTYERAMASSYRADSQATRRQSAPPPPGGVLWQHRKSVTI